MRGIAPHGIICLRLCPLPADAAWNRLVTLLGAQGKVPIHHGSVCVRRLKASVDLQLQSRRLLPEPDGLAHA